MKSTPIPCPSGDHLSTSCVIHWVQSKNGVPGFQKLSSAHYLVHLAIEYFSCYTDCLILDCIYKNVRIMIEI